MRIELQYPFNEDYKKGYLRRSKKDGRGRVDLVKNKKERTTISYARYLMSVEMGRYLDSDEEVDHIDEDCTNDSIENLQVILRKDHYVKSYQARSGRKYVRFTCPQCQNPTIKPHNTIFRGSSRSVGKIKFCSRSCNMKFHMHSNHSEELKSFIYEEQQETLKDPQSLQEVRVR